MAADALREAGFSAYGVGPADSQDYATTEVISAGGDSKGGYGADLAQALGISSADVIAEPDPNREADFTVTLGENYNPCPGGVLPLEGESEG